MKHLVAGGLIAIAATFAAAACFEDRYRCTTDAQCDVGTGGRCESTGYCSSLDVTCPTGFRYGEHSAELTNACYDDRVELANACAGGQGPARPEGCFADVCTRLPMCCETAWTHACVQLAQEVCDLTCDTRIAITANRNSTTELWDARWSGTSWAATRNTMLTEPLSWVAPAPGSIEPRLAGTTATSLVVGDTTFTVAAGRQYRSITSVSFDRRGFDTIAASYSAAGEFVEIRRLDDSGVRLERFPGAEQMSWGDTNRDGFPDAVAKDAALYSFYENTGVENFSRKLVNPATSSVAGQGTPGTPAIRSFDWLDFDRDGKLDLVMFGSSVRVHSTPEGVRDVPDIEIDCSPPSQARACVSDPEPNLERYSFVGTALPTGDQPELVFAQFPHRKVWRARLQGAAATVSQLPFPNDGCSCEETCTQCPGSGCTCAYDCATCPPVLAVVSRDLDHDHRLDLVAIDARLRVYTALAAGNFAWSAPVTIPTTFPNTFFTVNASVSGAPIP